MAKLSYLHLGTKPKPNEIVTTLRVLSSKGLSLKRTAEEIAAESSIGTWTTVGTLNKKTFNKLSARVIYINYATQIIKIAYPMDLFEKGNIPQLFATVAGNIFSMKILKSLRIEDIYFPDEYINSFPGPAFGIKKIRGLFKAKDRPLVGCIIKPKVGLTPKETAKLAYDVFSNGVDLIKDDETLTNMTFCKFEQRVKEVSKARDKAEKDTRSKKEFIFNVTAPYETMIERAKLVKKYGGHVIMIDVITTGFSALQSFRNRNLGLIIHGHRAGHSALTDDISMLVVSKLVRMSGVDEFHTGTVVGKMDGKKKDIIEINDFLRRDWGKLKKVMPVASGGLHPRLIEKLVKILGTDLIINFGGGIHGHPKGSAKGSMAAKQSIDAAAQGIKNTVYARDHKELDQALKCWKK